MYVHVYVCVNTPLNMIDQLSKDLKNVYSCDFVNNVFLMRLFIIVVVIINLSK